MASLLSYGACQTACNAGAVTRYAAAGYVFGTVAAGASIPAVIIGCNSALGSCMTACAAKFAVEGAAETAATGGIMGPVVAIGGAAIAIFGGLWTMKKVGQ